MAEHITRDELDLLREGWEFEAKLGAGRDGRGKVPEAFWETYSAFANTGGGIILLGAREMEGGALQVVGFEEIERVETELWNTLVNPQKVSVNLLLKGDVHRLTDGGRVGLVVRVPRAPRCHRPVFINGSWDKGTFIRVHSGDRAADRETARRMLADAQPDQDARVLEGFTEGDLAEESVRKYRQLFIARRPDHPFASEDVQGFLRQVGVLVRDRRLGTDGLSLGGLLALGKEAAIRGVLPHWHLSYREVAEDVAPERRWVDRITDDGTWNANLFEFYLRAVGKLHAALKVPFALDGSQFRTDESPAHTAIREALVNALVHADHAGRGGVRIVRSPTQMAFINPGLLLISPDQLWRGGLSESRNPVVQRLFSLLQLGEREGSGGPAIKKAWSHAHWRAPELKQDVEHQETHLVLRQESLLPELSVAALRERLGAAYDALSPLDRIALVTAHHEGSVSHARLMELSAENPRVITLRIQELVRRGSLVATARPRSDGYLLGPSGSSTQGNPANSDSNPANWAPNPTNPQDSPAKVDITPADDGAEPANVRTKRAYGASADLLKAVLAFCEGRWQSVEAIASAVGRKPSTVRSSYLRPLVAQGKLELLHPDTPFHPQQAFRTRMEQS